MTRREFLNWNGMAATGMFFSAAGCCGLLDNRFPVVRFGCVSDTHFGDLPNRMWNYFRDSARKMSVAMSEFRRQGVDFVIELGDLIDSGEQDKVRVRKSLLQIEKIFSSAQLPSYHVFGNHDFGSLSLQEFQKLTKMGGGALFL